MDAQGRFITRGDTPEWLPPFNDLMPAVHARGARWLAAGARQGAPPLRTLTFDPAHPEQFLALYLASPFSQTAQFDLLGEMLVRERLGREAPSISSPCCAAPPSCWVTRRAPVSAHAADDSGNWTSALKGLLAQLGRAVGENGYNWCWPGLTARRPCPPPRPRRVAVNGETVAQAVDKALAASGAGNVRKYLYPFLYLDPATDRTPEAVRLEAARAALDLAPVAGYYAPAAPARPTRMGAPIRQQLPPRRSGDLMLSYRPEYVEDYGQGRGISYGSLYAYDVRVPLGFYGPQFRAGCSNRRSRAWTWRPRWPAPWRAAPSSSVGRVLGEALL